MKPICSQLNFKQKAEKIAQRMRFTETWWFHASFDIVMAIIGSYKELGIA